MPERVVVAHPMSDGLVAPKRWEEFTFGPYKRLPSRAERVGEMRDIECFTPAELSR